MKVTVAILLQRKMDFLNRIPVHMDYVGQGRAEKLYQIIIGKKRL